MDRTYCLAIVRANTLDWRDESWVEERKPPKNAVKTTIMIISCSIHKHEPLEGRIGQGEHQNQRRMIMHGTISSIWRTNVCVSGGIYRRKLVKLNLRMTRILDFTQNACSWRPLTSTGTTPLTRSPPFQNSTPHLSPFLLLSPLPSLCL
jgi:hypothetical protein